MKEICHISPAEDHDFQVVKITWQTVANQGTMDRATYRTLSHSKDRFVCRRCGKIVDPFPEVKVA
jgi:hypothetical protein